MAPGNALIMQICKLFLELLRYHVYPAISTTLVIRTVVTCLVVRLVSLSEEISRLGIGDLAISLPLEPADHKTFSLASVLTETLGVVIVSELRLQPLGREHRSKVAILHLFVMPDRSWAMLLVKERCSEIRYELVDI